MHCRRQAKHSHPLPSATTAAASFIAAHHPEKPSARAVETVGRHYTVSIAIPGSIVLNAQTAELRGWLAGQVSRRALRIDSDSFRAVLRQGMEEDEMCTRRLGGGRWTGSHTGANAQRTQVKLTTTFIDCSHVCHLLSLRNRHLSRRCALCDANRLQTSRQVSRPDGG